jgi:hypothetical protein
MGTFAVKFVVSHPLVPGHRVELEGLVDTGALFTQIPEETLACIGITPSGFRSVHYADGAGAVVPVARCDDAGDARVRRRPDPQDVDPDRRADGRYRLAFAVLTISS